MPEAPQGAGEYLRASTSNEDAKINMGLRELRLAQWRERRAAMELEIKATRGKQRKQLEKAMLLVDEAIEKLQ